MIDLTDVQFDALLKRLHLANTRRAWQELVQRAEREEWSYRDFLALLVTEEIAQRQQTRIARMVRRARFPFFKTIDDFNFSMQSTVRLALLGSALAPDFVTEGRSLVLGGKPGRGKTHLAVAIAYRAIQNGFDALCVTAAELIDDLSAAFRTGRLADTLARYVHPAVLVVDEVGYLTYGTDAANMLFHVVNDRHRKKRTMIFTTNKPLTGWGRVLHDEDLAHAIVDRILERGRLLTLDGPSMRTRHLGLDDPTANPASTQSASLSGDGARISGIQRPEFPEPTPRIGRRFANCCKGGMARPLRIHAPGMLHHVMSRGNQKREMFIDHVDYARYLELLERAAQRFSVHVDGYCLMWNHVHLLLRPTAFPLWRMMQQVNSAYCGWFNRRHGRVGHVLQGRYKAQIVEGGPSFLRVLRYVMLNPVAAGYATRAQDWRWSSFRQAAGLEIGSTFLTLGNLWDMFDPSNRIHAQQCFQRFVDQPSVDGELASGLLVGSDGFVRRFEPALAVHRENRELVHAERFAARPPLSELLRENNRGPATREAASRAFHVHAFSLREIAEHIGVSPSAVWVWTRHAEIAA